MFKPSNLQGLLEQTSQKEHKQTATIIRACVSMSNETIQWMITSGLKNPRQRYTSITIQ